MLDNFKKIEGEIWHSILQEALENKVIDNYRIDYLKDETIISFTPHKKLRMIKLDDV